MISTGGSVNVCNLVDGISAIIGSPEGSFEDFIVHYAETVIIPEGIKTYSIRPEKTGDSIMLLKASIK